MNSSNEELIVTNESVSNQRKELEKSLFELRRTQSQLVRSEKMASLGVLTAGIAHEINNPINFVYAGINSLLLDFEDIEPVVNEINKLDTKTDNIQEKLEQIQKLKKDLAFDEAIEAIPATMQDIKLGAERTAEIVKGLSSFSRTDRDEMQYLDINTAIESTLVLLRKHKRT